MSSTHSTNPLRRRAAAARRCPPIRCVGRDLADRDPWATTVPLSTVALPGARQEARRLWRLGWQLWEITEATGIPE